MKFLTRSFLPLLVFFVSTNFIYAGTPDWEDDPGAYVHVSTLVAGIVFNDGEQLGDEGDLLAAFDAAGVIRGVAIQLNPTFGPYQGTILYEMSIRSNDAGDLITFQYYDASEDVVLDISETYEFVINEQLGHIITGAYELNIGFGEEACEDDNDAVAPLGCATAVSFFGCGDSAYGDLSILCPETC